VSILSVFRRRAWAQRHLHQIHQQKLHPLSSNFWTRAQPVVLSWIHTTRPFLGFATVTASFTTAANALASVATVNTRSSPLR